MSAAPEQMKGQICMETDNIFPDNWKEIIQGKKVIFYNTSVGSLLSGREKHIEKMKWVFGIFRKHPEVVLWWRPHPLELATVKSMIPALAQQYVEIQRMYQEENVGILDESTDLHRAIAISDAYYGDWSSVTHLYKAIKKPVLYEVDSVTRVVDTLFLPITLCVKEGAIWFIQLNSNKLIMVDRVTYEVKKIVDIPSEPSFYSRSYNYHIVDLENRLLILLEKSKQIYEYEIEKDTITVHRPQTENFVFRSEVVIEKDSKLLFFPYGHNNILEYDYCTDAVVKKEIGQKNLKLAKCHEIIGTKVYLVDKESNALYQYDIVNSSYDVTHIGGQDSKYWGVKKCGKYFVLPHAGKKTVTLWNEENGEITELINFPEQYACMEKFAYLDMFEKDGYVYIFPQYANMILKIDVEKKVITQAFTDIFFNTKYETKTEQINGGMYLCAKRYGNCVFAYATYKECWQILNLETMDVQESSAFEVKKTEHKDLLECLWNDREYDETFCENERLAICNLENYIKNIVNNDIGNRQSSTDKNSIGRKIHQHINYL